MLLSIITPCYNSESYIEEAICSVLLQNNENIELILVDDGSTDNTELICKKYVGKNIQYIKIKNNGAGHARNVGINKAKGQWIAFLDSDDLYLKGALNEEFCELLRKYNYEGIDIVYTPRIKIDMRLSQEPNITYPEEISSIQNYIPKLEFWTCIYNATFLKENNIKFYEYRKQDIESAFRFLAFSNASKIIKSDTMKFYLQRNNLKSNTHTWNLYNLYEVKGKVFYDLYKRSKDKEAKVKVYLLENVVTLIYCYYRLCLKNGCDSYNSDIEDMHLLLCNIKQCEEVNSFSANIKKQFIIIKIIDLLYKVLKKRTKKLKNHAIKQEDCLEKCELEDIMNRLENISKNLLEI